jgi:hypothetical protein
MHGEASTLWSLKQKCFLSKPPPCHCASRKFLTSCFLAWPLFN